jgi:RimJ/RimL family protein N-acetyltransferase/predicted nucleotidyltransferase
MSDIIQLNTSRLCLRDLTPHDATEIQALCNDEQISRTTIHIPYPYTLKDAQDWIQREISNKKNQKCITFAIQLMNSSSIIGAISIRITSTGDQREGLLSYWIGSDYWNQGFCTEAAQAMIEYGFTRLELGLIRAQHMKINPASGSVLKKLGFAYQCTKNMTTPKSGMRLLMDQYIYSREKNLSSESTTDISRHGIEKLTFKTLTEIATRHRIMGLFLGGSQSRGTSDQYSDRDFGCLYDPDKTNLDLFIDDLEESFGSTVNLVEKNEMLAYHFEDQQGRFEIRLTTIDASTILCKELEIGKPLTPGQQDLLSNIKFGQYLHADDEVQTLQNRIEYTDNLRSNMINQYLPLLTTQMLQIPIHRGDSFLIFHYGSELYSIALLLGLAQAKQFHTSLKHEDHLRQLLSSEANDFLNSLSQTIKDQSQDSYIALKAIDQTYRASLQQAAINNNQIKAAGQ